MGFCGEAETNPEELVRDTVIYGNAGELRLGHRRERARAREPRPTLGMRERDHAIGSQHDRGSDAFLYVTAQIRN